jgi:hypothetical protein
MTFIPENLPPDPMARLDSEVTRLREVARKLRVELEHETQNAAHVESPEVEEYSAD